MCSGQRQEIDTESDGNCLKYVCVNLGLRIFFESRNFCRMYVPADEAKTVPITYNYDGIADH